MPNLYYRTEDPSDLRDLSEAMPAWIEAGNPKAAAWTPAPPKPNDDAVWTNGAWVVPPVATMTAEEAVSQYFSPYQTLALQRFEMALLQAGKPLGTKMSACKQWLEGVMLGWAMNPTPAPAASFGSPAGGVTFEQASAEAVADLSSPNPET
jgi:hypothetical protein